MPNKPGVEKGAGMKLARFGRLAVLGAAVALAIPAMAQANEVTNWNEIAVGTINGQPAGVTSAPPAGGVLLAMVQGAVYGAVNAVDRHGQPYLVDRSFPKASADAAAATAAFRVLDTLVLGAARGAPVGVRRFAGGNSRTVPRADTGHRGRRVGGRRNARGGSRWPDGDRVHVRIPAWPVCGSRWPGRPGALRLAIRLRGWGTRSRSWPKSASQFRTAGPYALDSRGLRGGLQRGQVVSARRTVSSRITVPDPRRRRSGRPIPAANYNAIARRFVDQLSLDLSDSARLLALLDLTCGATR